MIYNRNDNIDVICLKRPCALIEHPIGGYDVIHPDIEFERKRKGPFRSIRVMAALVLVIIAGLMFGYIFAAYQSLPEVGNNMRPAVSSQVLTVRKLITTLHSDPEPAAH